MQRRSNKPYIIEILSRRIIGFLKEISENDEKLNKKLTDHLIYRDRQYDNYSLYYKYIRILKINI